MTIEIIVPGSVDGGAGKVCEEVVLPLDAARGGDGGVSRVVATLAPVKHVLRRPEPAQGSNQMIQLWQRLIAIFHPPT